MRIPTPSKEECGWHVPGQEPPTTACRELVNVLSSVCISCHSSRKSRQLLTCTRRRPSNAWLFSPQPEPRALTKPISIARVICTGTGSTTAQRCGYGRTNTRVLNGFLQPHTLQMSQYQLPSMQVRAYQRSTAPNDSKNLQESA